MWKLSKRANKKLRLYSWAEVAGFHSVGGTVDQVNLGAGADLQVDGHVLVALGEDGEGTVWFGSG